MSKLKEYSDTFETLSKSIVKYLLRDVDTEIVQTKSKKMAVMILLSNVKMEILENVRYSNAN